MTQNSLKRALIWAGSLATIVVFLLFQIRVQQEVHGSMGMIIDLVSFIIEMVVLLRINSFDR